MSSHCSEGVQSRHYAPRQVQKNILTVPHYTPYSIHARNTNDVHVMDRKRVVSPTVYIFLFCCRDCIWTANVITDLRGNFLVSTVLVMIVTAVIAQNRQKYRSYVFRENH